MKLTRLLKEMTGRAEGSLGRVFQGLNELRRRPAEEKAVVYEHFIQEVLPYTSPEGLKKAAGLLDGAMGRAKEGEKLGKFAKKGKDQEPTKSQTPEHPSVGPGPGATPPPDPRPW